MAMIRTLFTLWVAAWTLPAAVASERTAEPLSFTQHPAETPHVGASWESFEQGPVTADPRPAPPTSTAQDLLWVPRVILYPVYLASEYLFRRPLGWIMTQAEKSDWPNTLANLFTFDDERKIGLIPSAFYHFNFRTSGGLYFFGNDLGVPGHDVRAQLLTGGERWWKMTATDRWTVAERHKFQVHLAFDQRPDFMFHGLGPQTPHESRTRFMHESAEAHLQYELNYYRSSHLAVRTALEYHALDLTQTTGHDPSLAEGVSRGFFPTPAGPLQYNLLRTGIYSFFDNRLNHRVDGNGVSVKANLEYVRNLNGPAQWLTLAPRVAGHLDLSHNRVLSLSLAAEHQFRLSSDPIPFAEMLTVGNDPAVLGGFFPGRLRGPAVLALTLEYRYEVWALLDGTVFFTLGNVYGENFSGLDWGSLRPSYGIGISTIGRPDSKFHFLFAFGHDTFAQGGGFDGAQLILGYRPNL